MLGVSVREGALSLRSPPEALFPRPGRFWIESPYSTGYQVSLVSNSESNFVKQKIFLKNLNFFWHTLQNIAHLLEQIFFCLFLEGGSVCMSVSRTGPKLVFI